MKPPCFTSRYHTAKGKFEGIHFNQGHLESMGHSLCEVLLELVDPDQSKVEQIVRDLTDK